MSSAIPFKTVCTRIFILITLSLSVQFYFISSRADLPFASLPSSSLTSSLPALNDLTPSFLRSSSPVVIAYAVSITSCPSSVDAGLTDGAAVLSHSIALASSHPSSRYRNYKLYALVHTDADASRCTGVLRSLGYEIVVVPTPVAVPDIRGAFLREKIVKNGCCGEKELIKFYAYTLVDHPVVVHLDLDVLVLQPLDELFDLIIEGEADALYTYDYNMVNPGRQAGTQGGFLVIRPSMSAFSEYREIVLEGDYTLETGWGKTNIGYFWGGMTFQGLVPYFYLSRHPGTERELDRCVYNSMSDNPRSEKGLCRDGKETCKDCRETPIEDIKTVHFTICQKPWMCHMYADDKRQVNSKLCRDFHNEWFRVRKSFEVLKNTYNTHKYSGTIYQGFCSGFGEDKYRKIPFVEVV